MSRLIEVTCLCGRVFKAKAEHAGRTGRCGACGGAIHILGAEPEEVNVLASIVTDGPRVSVDVPQKRFSATKAIFVLAAIGVVSWISFSLWQVASFVEMTDEQREAKVAELRAEANASLDQDRPLASRVTPEVIEAGKRIAESGRLRKIQCDLNGIVLKAGTSAGSLFPEAVPRGRVEAELLDLMEAAKVSIKKADPKDADASQLRINIIEEMIESDNHRVLDVRLFYESLRTVNGPTWEGFNKTDLWFRFAEKTIIRSVTAKANGSYEMTGLKGGRYYIHGINASPKGDRATEWMLLKVLDQPGLTTVNLTSDNADYSISR